ncbi:RnfABCDGE type electron transport complex subunit B [Neisseria shayeganii]|uniref:NADH:ubiquinone oxidoreductase subunit RnfB n=2 Tax=Neisseria shayeganii TaxID=607712 RepID=G4CF56_9NEIS|nr:RnfABCDGE type electron transport complex subunit B [Neisseria shayeganii]EGY53594.1 NADH:ubiquinone oxidoreductase subunit RnfB [Neisseria shayeganii 871]QMT41454.1 RnfABCDGE type electron transport complex subunit B [Neisseria shayeganii]
MSTAADLEALLPQTQCRQCGFDGCAPYAEAMAAGEAGIHLCPPGGETVMRELAALLDLPPRPLEQADKAATPKVLAYIDEAACIGCTACIKACPVDAIMGASKQMHTVLADECTGCELCLPPCPVDCIELHPVPDAFLPRARPERRAAAAHAKTRYQRRQTRLQRLADERSAYLAERAAAHRAKQTANTEPAANGAIDPAALIAQAMARAQALQNQRSVPSNREAFREREIADAQDKAAFRRAQRDVRYGDEAQKAAAIRYLKERKAAEEQETQSAGKAG